MDINVVLDHLKIQIGDLSLQVAMLKAKSQALEEKIEKTEKEEDQ